MTVMAELQTAKAIAATFQFSAKAVVGQSLTKVYSQSEVVI